MRVGLRVSSQLRTGGHVHRCTHPLVDFPRRRWICPCLARVLGGGTPGIREPPFPQGARPRPQGARPSAAAFARVAPDPTGTALGFVTLRESRPLHTSGAFETIPALSVRPEVRSQGLGLRLLSRKVLRNLSRLGAARSRQTAHARAREHASLLRARALRGHWCPEDESGALRPQPPKRALALASEDRARFGPARSPVMIWVLQHGVAHPYTGRRAATLLLRGRVPWTATGDPARAGRKPLLAARIGRPP